MRIGVCDDEKAAREMLAERVRSLYPQASIVCYASGEELLQEIELPDILFLDICMNGINGMEAARRLRQMDGQMILIFVTAAEDFVYQAFDVGAFHYLLKPFCGEKFQEVMEKAAEQLSGRVRKPEGKRRAPDLMITAGGAHIAVNFADVVYAEVFNRKVVIHTMNDDIAYYGKIKELEEKAGDNFYRTHRAYLVNFDYIRKYDARMVYLEKGQVFIAKQNYREFVKRYLEYIRQKGNA